MTPHRFQSGFVANRIARFERRRLGDESITMVAMADASQLAPESVWTGKAPHFYVRRDGKDGPEYWISHNDGFMPMPKQLEGR